MKNLVEDMLPFVQECTVFGSAEIEQRARACRQARAFLHSQSDDARAVVREMLPFVETCKSMASTLSHLDQSSVILRAKGYLR